MDVPIAYVLGCVLGILHLILVPSNPLFLAIFEVVASIVMSFLARLFGSLNQGTLFCFSSLAQSGTALILPGCK